MTDFSPQLTRLKELRDLRDAELANRSSGGTPERGALSGPEGAINELKTSLLPKLEIEHELATSGAASGDPHEAARMSELEEQTAIVKG